MTAEARGSSISIYIEKFSKKNAHFGLHLTFRGGIHSGPALHSATRVRRLKFMARSVDESAARFVMKSVSFPVFDQHSNGDSDRLWSDKDRHCMETLYLIQCIMLTVSIFQMFSSIKCKTNLNLTIFYHFRCFKVFKPLLNRFLSHFT